MVVALLSGGGTAVPPAPANVPPSSSGSPHRVALDPDVAATVDQILVSAQHPGLTWSAIPDVAPALKTAYDAEPDRLIWFAGSRPVATLDRTLVALAAAGDHGLSAADYDAAPLGDQWTRLKSGAVSSPERTLFDVAVSVGAARMLKAVPLGRVDPATMLWGYDVAAKPFDLVARFREAREAGLAATLEALEPPVAHYQRARAALAAYRALAAAGEPAPVPAVPRGSKVAPGAAWAGVPQLAARLRAFGDLPAGAEVDSSGDAPLLAGALVDALKGFQRRHGLEADGVIGPGTVRALNVSIAARARQIELSMERMRWLPALSERPNVFVNVALFRLWATDPVTGAEPLRMNVVVGESLDHRTPLFVEQMEYVIFRPYWNPPRGITVKEIVPKAQRDPNYFANENLEIVATGADNAPALPPNAENLAQVMAGRLFVRQKPGPRNSVGLAKFIFPNAEDVYMHGTPAQSLFARARRDFSHGCIRLQDPARFAEWVLRDQPEWTRARIDAAMKGERPTRVNLKEKLTVVIFYATVHVNSEGVVFFVDDIYGHDRTLDAALAQGYPYPVKDAAAGRSAT